MAASALLMAARSRNKAALGELVERGVDVNMLLDEDCGQWSTLHLLAADGDQDGCEVLVDSGANVAMACTGDGYQPLHLAARNGHIETVQLLLSKGADVNATDEHGYTALHYCAAFDHALLASVLLRKGAEASAKDSMGCTAAALAKAASHQEVYDVIADNESLEAGIGRVARWLTAIGLVEHADKFVEAGLDDLNFLAEVGLTDADVDKLGIEKLGHRKKLTALYRIREFLQPSPTAAPAAPAVGSTDAAGAGAESTGGDTGAATDDGTTGDSDDDDDDDDSDSDGDDDDSDDSDDDNDSDDDSDDSDDSDEE